MEAPLVSSSPQHWPSMAAVWEQIGPPLRPCAEDIALYQRLSEPALRSGAPRILLLGVTPELYRIPWPRERDFLAIDHTLPMIENVWPGRSDEAFNGEWQELSLPENSRDLALCDGGLHLLSYPEEQKRLVARLAEVVRPDGLSVFRFFALPAKRESCDSVLRDLFSGKILELNSLKLRLGMALQKSSEGGVPVKEVRSVLREAGGDWPALAARLHWPLPHLRAIDAYQGSPSRYHFLSLDGAIELFCSSGDFRLGEVAVPTYALGERCPLVSFVRV